ncbi:MAG TPA: hypothetical protein VGU20_20195 [Stellaceae bacterium]|nr:hypothetical protein [Stellaceae bacterium]
MRGALVRYSLPLAGLCIFTAFATLYAGAPYLYTEILTGLGIEPFRYPFLDGQYVLAGAECWHFGINVYLSDPCDVLNRPHGYSPLWLRLPVIPMSMTIPLGVGLAIIFILSLAVVAPVQRGREFGLGLLAATSPMVLFALERANLDLIVFLLVVAAGVAWPRLSGGWRLLAYGPPLLAALLKYYPLTLLCLTLREWSRAFLVATAASFGAVAVFIAAFHGEVLASLHNIPGGGYATRMFGADNPAETYFIDNFGAPVLLGGADQLMTIFTALPDTLAHRIVRISIIIVTALLAVVPAIRMARTSATRASIAQLSPRRSFFLVSGAALIAGCFFAGQSLNYRGVHLLFVLPAFLALSEREAGQQDRSRFWWMSLVIVFLMWGDCFRTWLSDDSLVLARLGLWLIRELLWWWLAGSLVGVLLCFALEAPLCHELRVRFDWRNRHRLAPAQHHDNALHR